MQKAIKANEKLQEKLDKGGLSSKEKMKINKKMEIILKKLKKIKKEKIIARVKKMKMIFIPFKQVGIFQLDDDVSRYSDVLANYFHRPDKIFDGKYYEYYHSAEPYSAEDTHMLQVVDGKIRAVFCDESLIYNGINLIGLTIDELKNITNANYVGEIYEADLFDDKPPMYDYDFDEIGITARTHYDRIVDITASGYWSYEED